MSVQTIADIQQLVLSGETDWQQYGHVYTREQDGLLLFNYSAAAQFEDTWTPFECMCRGLIINQSTGEIVARPFDKFFNWNQGGRKASGHIVTVTEKIDGTLGILYRQRGDYRIATRGSFDGPQAIWATEFLRDYYDLAVPDHLTLLFEIIYPDNRHVVDYGNREDLILLAARNRHTGDYLPFFPDLVAIADANCFHLPRTFSFNRVEDLLALAGEIDVHTEGWVVEFSDGSRWKIKGDRYLELHKTISGLSFKRVLVAHQTGGLTSLLDVLPDTYIPTVLRWVADINTRLSAAHERVHVLFNNAPKADRKTFAKWVMEHGPDDAACLFALWDKKDILPLLYQREFVNGDMR